MAEAVALNHWKESMWTTIKARYKDEHLSKDKVMAYLDDIIHKNVKNPSITMVNNYTNSAVRTDILSMTDLIEKHGLIMGAGGMLYYPHHMRHNVLIDFIRYVMKERKFWKKERKKYDKGSYEWLECDIKQLAFKLVEW